MSEVKYPDATVTQSDLCADGNVFAVMGKAAQALRRAGHGDAVKPYMEDAMSADYNHALAVTMQYVNVTEG